jgi:hypothetical protein
LHWYIVGRQEKTVSKIAQPLLWNLNLICVLRMLNDFVNYWIVVYK